MVMGSLGNSLDIPVRLNLMKEPVIKAPLPINKGNYC